jgi:hypothetical protein
MQTFFYKLLILTRQSERKRNLHAAYVLLQSRAIEMILITVSMYAIAINHEKYGVQQINKKSMTNRLDGLYRYIFILFNMKRRLSILIIGNDNNIQFNSNYIYV